jgi:hypothetical protein
MLLDYMADAGTLAAYYWPWSFLANAVGAFIGLATYSGIKAAARVASRAIRGDR